MHELREPSGTKQHLCTGGVAGFTPVVFQQPFPFPNRIRMKRARSGRFITSAGAKEAILVVCRALPQSDLRIATSRKPWVGQYHEEGGVDRYVLDEQEAWRERDRTSSLPLLRPATLQVPLTGNAVLPSFLAIREFDLRKVEDF